MTVGKEVLQGKAPVEGHEQLGTFDGHFLWQPAFYQSGCDSAHEGHIFRGMILADTGIVFPKGHIQSPMK